MTASSLQPIGYQLTKTSQVYGSKGSGDREMVPKYNHRALTRGRKWVTHFTYRRGRNVTTETEVGCVVTHYAHSSSEKKAQGSVLERPAGRWP